jgi:hypothetical protein
VNPRDVVVLGIVCHRLGEVVVGTVAFGVNADCVVTLGIVCHRLADAVVLPVDLNQGVRDASDMEPPRPSRSPAAQDRGVFVSTGSPMGR